MSIVESRLGEWTHVGHRHLDLVGGGRRDRVALCASPRPCCARPWALGKRLAHLVCGRPHAQRGRRSTTCLLAHAIAHAGLVRPATVRHSMCTMASHLASQNGLQRRIAGCWLSRRCTHRSLLGVVNRHHTDPQTMAANVSGRRFLSDHYGYCHLACLASVCAMVSSVAPAGSYFGSRNALVG